MKVFLAITSLFLLSPTARALPQLDLIKLPSGFSIEVYAEHVDGARSMALGPEGMLFVGTRGSNVYAITKDRKVFIIAKGLKSPNGVAYRNGDLYIAEISRISKLPKIASHLQNPPALELVRDGFPTAEHHGWKYIAFGPDGFLYVPVGAPCNVCKVEDPYAALSKMSPDGKSLEIVARGIRNTVGFDWQPRTHDLWFTDNGRDMLGDDLPPDELNHLTKTGQNFGFPFCHGGNIPDPEFGTEKKCSEFVPPVQKLGAHVASLGMKFYTGAMFPKKYKDQIFIAEHGSWNRSKKSGYRVSLVELDKDGKAKSYSTFAEGWKQGENNWGRPVDIAIAPDGSLLVSDDQAGAIYRISYRGK